MSNSNRIFAEAVNDLMEKLLTPILAEEKANLIKEGIKPELIDSVMLSVKTDTQAKILPRIKQLVKEGLKEKLEQMRANESAEIGSKKTPSPRG
jgi:hypothetical protein